MSTINFAAKVSIPPPQAINSGLAPCGNSLKNIFGIPGPLEVDCNPVTNQKLKRYLVTKDVGPFTVTGLKPAVASLERIFTKVHQRDKKLYAAMKTAGMLCCRLIRRSKSTFSIHSWGGAIDLYCGTGVVPLGQPFVHVGVLRVYPYFHAEGWYSGMEFDRADAMHNELARQTVADYQRRGWLPSD